MANAGLSPSGHPKPLFPQGGMERAPMERGSRSLEPSRSRRNCRRDPSTAAALPINPGTANCGSRARSRFSLRKKKQRSLSSPPSAVNFY